MLPRQVLNIGLTGGIGSGKSTVAQRLSAHGLAVVDLDRIAHRLTDVDGFAMPAIQAQFGSEAILPDGRLNRSYMRALVFDSPEQKQVLEGLMRPLLVQETVACAHNLAALHPNTALIYDIPLLVENPFWLTQLDWVVVVDCTRAEQVTRILRRNPDLEPERAHSIIDAQATREVRNAVANVLLDNRVTECHAQGKKITGINAYPLNLGRQVDILVNHLAMLMHQHVRHRK